MTFRGVSFRETAGYVTDGTDDTYCTGDDTSVTRKGLTFGWTAFDPSKDRDRVAGGDARLAGICFHPNTGSPGVFSLTLPDGPGKYNIRLALGDAGSGQNNFAVIKDGSTVLATIGPTATELAEFVDAAGTPTKFWTTENQPIQKTFVGSVLTLELGGAASGSTANGAIAHIAIEFVGGAPSEESYWSVPTNAPEGTIMHMMVFEGTAPNYTILKQGPVTANGGYVGLLATTGTDGDKHLAVLHNYDGNVATTSIYGGPAIATRVTV